MDFDAAQGFDTNQETNLIYPIDHQQSANSWLVLIEYEYSRPSFDSSFTPKATNTTITLPIPNNLSAAYSSDWGTDESLATTNLLANNLQNVVNNTDKIKDWLKKSRNQSLSENAKALTEQLKTNGVDFGTSLGKAVASDFITSSPIVSDAAARQGYARNPWLAAVFKGVDFRSWNFSYNFFPKSFKESQAIENIYTAMKFGMLPSYDETFENNLFKYPNMYAPLLQPNEYLFEFGFSVIKSVEIDYHASGKPLYFNHEGKKIPAHMKLSFNLSEIEIVTKESVKNTGNKVSQILRNRGPRQGGVVRGR